MEKYIILGIVQGLTEFFPVSSSAHLVILQKIFCINGKDVVLPVVLHLGTALSLIIFFFKDLVGLFKNLKLLYFILIVSLITGVIGFLGKDFFESLFSSVKFVAVALVITSVVLFLTKKFMDGKRQSANLKDALILGFTQAIAIVPGISRSGITVSTLLFRGIKREEAFKLSFIVSIPVILGAALLEFKKIGLELKADFFNLSVGFISSFIAGLLSLWLLRLLIAKAKLYYFGYYCIIVAIITLIFIK
ncbi:MAG: undecaprenyl-diphosphate phosphatase [Candidatus Omnitrophica bacterium]|nr:undecaprenyl-diphosphate phosphatase [Candidatus Omnitrophota bacterium]